MAQLPENELIGELTAFLEGERDLFQLEAALRDRVTFERPGQIGVIRILGALPVVALKKEHLLGALGRTLNKTWPVPKTTSWAAAILVLDCFDLEAPSADQDVLSATMWDLANEGAHDQLSPGRLRELIDRILDAAA